MYLSLTFPQRFCYKWFIYFRYIRNEITSSATQLPNKIWILACYEVHDQAVEQLWYSWQTEKLQLLQQCETTQQESSMVMYTHTSGQTNVSLAEFNVQRLHVFTASVWSREITSAKFRCGDKPFYFSMTYSTQMKLLIKSTGSKVVVGCYISHFWYRLSSEHIYVEMYISQGCRDYVHCCHRRSTRSPSVTEGENGDENEERKITHPFCKCPSTKHLR